MPNSYKIYQLFHFFISRFSYQILNTKEQDRGIYWLINPKNPSYPYIRITTHTLEQVVFEKEKIEETLYFIRQQIPSINGRFLDIHISREEVGKNELYDSLCLDSDYYSGVDLSSIFPGIHQVIHEVINPMQEVGTIVAALNQLALQRQRQQKTQRFAFINVTNILSCLAVIVFLAELFLSLQHSLKQSSILIILGADYKMFTLGAYQFWRLLTSAFVHGSWIHLAVNLLALNQLGNYAERTLGKRNYLIVFFISILTGSLCANIFYGNALSFGLSGGIYGLFALLIWEMVDHHSLDVSYLRTIFVNILLSFLPGINIYAHIGGFAAGSLFYFIFLNKQKQKLAISCLVAILLATSIRFIQARISPIYKQTDQEVVTFYRNIGFKNYAESLEKRLTDRYQYEMRRIYESK